MIIVFFTALIVNVLWVLYIRAVNKDRTFTAAFLDTMLYGSSAYVTINYVSDNIMLIPTLLGAFAGTVLAMKLGKHLDKKYGK